MSDCEINPSDPPALGALKTELERLISRDGPRTTREEREIEVLKFRIMVYYAVVELFRNGLSENVHLVETGERSVELTTKLFGDQDEVPVKGQFRRIQTKTMFRFALHGFKARVPLKLDDFLNIALLVGDSIREHFEPLWAHCPLTGETVPFTAEEVEIVKRHVHFVKHDFETDSIFDGVNDFVGVKFYAFAIDPITHPNEYQSMMKSFTFK